MRETINAIGTVDSRKVSIDFSGQIEMHMAFEKIGTGVDAIMEECMSRYKEVYPDIDTINDVQWDFRLIYTAGMDNSEYSEFMADLYIWQKTDESTGKDTCEYYGDIPLVLNELDKQKVKQMITDKMSEIFFLSTSVNKATA